MLLTELENAFARLRSCLRAMACYGFAKKEKEKEKKAWLQQLLLDGKKNGDIQLVRLQSLLSLMCRE